MRTWAYPLAAVLEGRAFPTQGLLNSLLKTVFYESLRYAVQASFLKLLLRCRGAATGLLHLTANIRGTRE